MRLPKTESITWTKRHLTRVQSTNVYLHVVHSMMSVGHLFAPEQKLMAVEALGRRNNWEPSVFYSLGKESFCFVGHDISIRESIDTYGALIWPGVSVKSDYCSSVNVLTNSLSSVLLCAIFLRITNNKSNSWTKRY